MKRPLKSMLASKRIIHLTANLPGPLAASYLQAYGASVVKVEPPSGDPLFAYDPEWYRQIHKGQRILRLDLKAKDDRHRFDKLLKTADLFITSLRPQALKTLRLDETSLRKSFPSLPIVFIQGHNTPHHNVATHDLTCQASAGLVQAPHLPRVLVADYGAAERAFSASLLALFASKQSISRGLVFRVILAEITKEWALPLARGATSAKGLLGGAAPHYGLYRARDGWIAVAALEAHFLKRLLNSLQVKTATKQSLAKAFKLKTKAEWQRLGRRLDIPLVAVREGMRL